MVDVLVAVEVMNAAAFSILHKNRIGLIVAVITGDSERNAFESPLVRRRRFRSAFLVAGDFLLQCVVHVLAPWRVGRLAVTRGRSIPCGQYGEENCPKGILPSNSSNVRRRPDEVGAPQTA